MSPLTLSQPGTLIHARGREWVVLPESTDDLLLARPIGGLDEEVAGILPAIEPVTSTTFPLPSADDIGDFRSGRLLRDAARLSTRSASGPFRSFGRIAVEPRPYQLVPLMMALRLDPVRLLIADDVGIGKTVEAALIARELLDRGEIRRFAVLCPPHLAEQWQRELAQKFHIEAELVLSSTIQRLEREIGRRDESVFDRYPYTVVSTDFIKTPQRAHDFVLKCPELVIVDEAHGATLAGGQGRGRQLRHDLLRRVAADPDRHVVLVTATPHSGNEDAFRSLLGLLDERFRALPADLGRDELRPVRDQLARHLVQRRRADIRHYLEQDTSFPERLDKEVSYNLGADYLRLFEDIVSFARGYVSGDDREGRRRVRYWSALALLRCVSSSPAAAASTLRSRAAVADAATEDVDEIGRRTVLDQDDVDDTAVFDLTPGADADGEPSDQSSFTRRQLLEFARRAESLPASADQKLQRAIKEIRSLVDAGASPIVFCRFLDTAEYVARHLRDALGAKARVDAVTGELPPSERELRIAQLVDGPGAKVLVCTDCLSEGVNLQEHFTAVVHYDLAWNPTRHEQREGRVDRFGQHAREVHVVTYYGANNPMDGVILDVLIRKHKSIRSALGVTVAVPGSSEQVAEALFAGTLLRERSLPASTATQGVLLFDEEDARAQRTRLHDEWDRARDREKASRSRFAQRALQPEEVAAELARVREAIGGAAVVARFTREVLRVAGVPVTEGDGGLAAEISGETPRGLRQAIDRDKPFSGRFELPLSEGDVYLGRTSPVVEGLAGWTLDQALDTGGRDRSPIAARCGLLATRDVRERTTLLVVRFRTRLALGRDDADTLLCEEIVPVAATGAGEALRWQPTEEAERLLEASPSGNVVATLVSQQVEWLTQQLPRLRDSLEGVAVARAQEQLRIHQQVREVSRRRGRMSASPVLPVDVLGAYVLLPRA
jgi:superfamily II DNA or RNA helicase